MLQVLVSIQGMILVEEPFYNEPGKKSSYLIIGRSIGELGVRFKV